MSPHVKKHKEKKRKNFFRKWHRRLAFGAAIFLLNLAITGILLNHSEDLNLHKRYLTSDWLVNLYNIKSPNSARCIKLAPMPANLCQLGEKIFLDESLLISESLDLVGVVYLNELYYIATVQAIYIYTKDFALVEILNEEFKLPLPVATIGLGIIDQQPSERILDSDKSLASERIVIGADDKYWTLDQETAIWKEVSTNLSVEVKLVSLGEKSLERLQEKYLNYQITQLKFIQDLHSGRLLLNSGTILTDLTGVAVILLALSGFIAWQRRKEGFNENNHRRDK